MFEKGDQKWYPEYDLLSEIIENAYSKIKFIPDTLLLIEITLLRMLRRHTRGSLVETAMAKGKSPEKKTTTPKDTI
jgi:hypothetical protein